MKAMILAAGLGTRLRPLTRERAKPAIPLLGKPLVLRLVEGLLAQGITGFRLNLHHLPLTIEDVFRTNSGKDLPVSFSYESEILGTAGGLKSNESYFDDGTFIMVNGDIIADFDLEPALEFHKANHAIATLILVPQYPPYRFFQVRIDNTGALVDFKGCNKNGTPTQDSFVFTGAHIIEPEIFDFIPPSGFSEIIDAVYLKAIHVGKRVLGFPVNGYWNDLGDPKRYLEAERDLLKRNGGPTYVFMSRDAEVSPDASIGPFTSIGGFSSIGPHVSIADSILWEDVHIRPGLTVSNCIVGRGVELTTDCRDMVITKHGAISIEHA